VEIYNYLTSGLTAIGAKKGQAMNDQSTFTFGSWFLGHACAPSRHAP